MRIIIDKLYGLTGQLDPHEGIPRSGIEAVAVLVLRSRNLLTRDISFCWVLKFMPILAHVVRSV